MEHDTKAPLAYRVIGWIPDRPGSVQFLGRDLWTMTRHAHLAATFDTYAAAEAQALALAQDSPSGISRWRPTQPHQDDLRELQAHQRPPRRPDADDARPSAIPPTRLF